jgi:hypothetical protein
MNGYCTTEEELALEEKLAQAQAALKSYSSAYWAIVEYGGTDAERMPLYKGMIAWAAEVVRLGGEV